MKYEWLLFDLDNTLLDFDASERYALAQSLENKGIAFQPQHLATYETINRACWNAFEAGTLPQASINQLRFEQFLEAIQLRVDAIEFGNYYLNELANAAFLINGTLDLLKEQSIHYKLGIVTNGLKSVQRPKLNKNNLTQYFKMIVVSDEIGVAKPHTPFFDYAFKEMQFPAKEKVLIIGDSLNSDIKGGINYGIDTCWYNPKELVNTSAIQPTHEVNALAQLKALQII